MNFISEYDVIVIGVVPSGVSAAIKCSETNSKVLIIDSNENIRGQIYRAPPNTYIKKKENRGMFCMMGSCQECVVLLDGKKVTSCNIFIKEGMAIKTGDLNEL